MSRSDTEMMIQAYVEAYAPLMKVKKHVDGGVCVTI
jgi:hypothetical protein